MWNIRKKTERKEVRTVYVISGTILNIPTFAL